MAHLTDRIGGAVLRRPPPATPGAHDVLREARILATAAAVPDMPF